MIEGMYKKILYPISLNELSLEVLSCIVHFKRVDAREIVLLHVIEAPGDDNSPLNAQRSGHIAELKMNEAVKLIEGAGLKAKKIIKTGIPYREILGVAAKEKVSLIASGRQKQGLPGEIFIGPTTDKLIRYGDMPVYIPKHPAVFGGDKERCIKHYEIPFGRVLYPTDWSVCAETALEYIKGLKNTGVGEIIIAHVMDEKAMKMLTPKKLKEFWNADKEKLESVKHDLEKQGVKVKLHIRIGKPNTDIIRIAKEENISLIIMGSHGKGYVKGIL